MREELAAEQALFCQHEHSRLIGAITLYTGDRDMAEDVAQEALARACAAWARVSRMRAPGAWVHRVAVNLAKRQLRRRSTARAASLRLAGLRSDRQEDPDSGDAVAVRAAVAALPHRQKSALILRYYLDLSVADTARALGCAEGTVKALTHQALSSLRATAALADEEEVSDGHV